MTLGLVGRKCGMTRVFNEEGVAVPVTVIEVLPNRITQLKTQENDGYQAIQISTGTRKRSRVSKPQAGHFAKANVEPGVGVWEFRVDSLEGFTLGGDVAWNSFVVGEYVDVSGVTKGKGFAGVIKRHRFAAQDATHGNSLSHRAPGSIGQRQSPGRVFKGKRMAGHLGNVKRTVMSQLIVKLEPERNLMLIRGAVPGAPGGYVVIRPAVKKQKKGGAK